MNEEVEDATNPLMDFTWDDGGDHEFFGIKPEEDPLQIQNVIQEAKKEGVKVTKKTETKKKEEKVEEEEEIEEKEEEETQQAFFEENEEDDNNEVKPGSFTTITKSLITSKIFENVELDKDEEIDEESFHEIFGQEIEARVEEGFQSFMDELSDDGKAFLKFAKNGGTIQQFAQVFKNLNQMPEVDINSEEGQKIIIRYYLKTVKQMDNEDVDEQIEFYEDKNKLRSYAEKYKALVDKETESEKEALIEQQEVQRRQAEENRKLWATNIKKSLEASEILGIPIGKKDKDLYAYIINASVKIGPNRYLTGLQQAMNDAFNDPQKVVLIAKLLKNNFDMSDIKAAATTEATKKVKRGIEKNKEGSGRPASSSSVIHRKGKSLADMF
jgi:hypothetical protein